MSNTLKFCSCKMCRRGRHGGYVRQVNRRLRHLAKVALRKGDEPERLIGVPYTD